VGIVRHDLDRRELAAAIIQPRRGAAGHRIAFDERARWPNAPSLRSNGLIERVSPFAFMALNDVRAVYISTKTANRIADQNRPGGEPVRWMVHSSTCQIPRSPG
jgi:hypothetical protein